jgi:putative membrane protein
MIVRDRPSGMRLFLLMRGSVLPGIWKSLAATTLLAVIVTWTHTRLWEHTITLTTIPFTLMGLPLAIFLGFRNNSAYDRYWEGRKQWGEIVLHSRNLSRQCLNLIDPGRAYAYAPDDVRARMVYRAIAFAYALKHALRNSDGESEVARWVDADEWQRVRGAVNRPHFLILEMGADLARCLSEGRVDSCIAPAIDRSISGMIGAATACERIRNTPIPFSYTLLLHRTAYLYCYLLPFGLVGSIGYMTPFVVAIVAYTFFGLDKLGDEIEEPFGTLANDLPLDAICRMLEIDLRQALGEQDLPAPLQPVKYRLT